MSGRLSFNDVEIDLWLTLPLINSLSHLYFYCYINLFCKTSQLRTLIISSRSESSKADGKCTALEHQAQLGGLHLSAFQLP